MYVNERTVIFYQLTRQKQAPRLAKFKYVKIVQKDDKKRCV